MTRHTLKSWPVYFRDLLSGVKAIEVRKGMDRTYRVGDELLLHEWAPESKVYTRRTLLMRVTYVMHGGSFLPEDVWVMAVKKVT